METATLLRKTVAEFFGVDEGQVGPSFSLQARQGSIARATLDAAIRSRVGLKSQAVYSAKTFGELEAEIAPGSSPAPPPARVAAAVAPPPAPPGLASGVSCGVDIELIASLPAAADPWEHEFYRGNFTPAEIAYCLRQPEPATHFAARWCAKEALKKCDQAFLAVDPGKIEVVLDEAGAPRLEYSDGSEPSRRLPHAVSLSHTSHAAVAVVVAQGGPVLASAPVVGPVAPIAAPAPPIVPPRRGSALLLALNLLAIALAALALTRTFPGFRSLFSG